MIPLPLPSQSNGPAHPRRGFHGEDDPVYGAAQESATGAEIDRAWQHITSGLPASGIRLLEDLEARAQPYWNELSAAMRYRVHYVRAAGAIQLEAPEAARADLEQAAPLAAQPPGGAEVGEQVLQALGVTYYQQDQAARALGYHAAGLHAMQTGIVWDRNLQLLIYSHLAYDYLVLNQPAAAGCTFHEARALLHEISNTQQEAAIYAGLSQVY